MGKRVGEGWERVERVLERYWLHIPCRLEGPQRFKAGTKPPVVHKWAHIILCVSGVYNASKRGTKVAVAHNWVDCLHSTCRLQGGGGGNASKQGTKSAVAHKWAGWLHNPCRLGGPQCFKPGDKINSDQQVTWWLHNPCSLGDPQHFKARNANSKIAVPHKW